MSKIAVIGLGQFGMAIARQLHFLEQEVLVVDRERDQVEAIADVVEAAICMDATDEAALAGLELQGFDCVIVAMGAHSVEASILTSTLLRQSGVPRIIARAADSLHARVLRAVGAHEVVDPEEEMGRRLAERLTYPGVVAELELGDATVAELKAPTSMIGKTLAELKIRNRYGATVLAIRRDESVMTNPGPHAEVQNDDILVVLGGQEDVRKMARHG